MAKYFGEVRPNEDDNTFPFIALISDEAGAVVAEFPVRTEADGEAKIVEVLRGLKNEAEKGDA